MLRAAIDQGREQLTGTVRLALCKRSATVVRRQPPMSLCGEDDATFEAGSVDDRKDVEGLIRLDMLWLRTGAPAPPR